MKVLLLGDFSSLHKYLKDGLKSLSVDVKLASNGDGWKRIGGADILLPVLSGPKSILEYARIIRSIEGYDVVQLIHSGMFPSIISDFCIRSLKKRNDKLFLVSAGSDYRNVRAYLSHSFDYYTLDNYKEPLIKFSTDTLSGRFHIHNSKEIESLVNCVIPSLYEYSVGYEDANCNVSEVVPFPINTEEIEYRPNKVNKKLVFYHGVTRADFKGTPLIVSALKELEDRYPNDVEVVVAERMPFNEYINVINRTNVVVDQCCSYGYGINACISMAKGKVVLSGARNETIQAYGQSNCPIIGIRPVKDLIFQRLLYILDNRKEIEKMGEEAREYVCRVHDCRIIASKYVNIWREE